MPLDIPPCTKDCPLRTPTCHSSCPDYAEYAAEQARKRADRFKAYQTAYDVMGVRRDKIVPIAKRKNKEKT